MKATTTPTCPKCGAAMEKHPASTKADREECGLDHPAYFACEDCDYTENAEGGPAPDTDNDQRWLDARREDVEPFDECTGPMN